MLHGVPAAGTRDAGDRIAEQRPAGELLGVGSTHRVGWVEPLTVQVVRGAATLAAAETVEWTAYAAAEPDPFIGEEAALLEHLVDAHTAEVRTICTLLDPPPALVDGLVAPVQVDRYGLVVRVRAFGPAFGAVTVRDARVGFGRRLDALDDIAPCFAELVDRASALASAGRPRD